MDNLPGLDDSFVQVGNPIRRWQTTEQADLSYEPPAVKDGDGSVQGLLQLHKYNSGI